MRTYYKPQTLLFALTSTELIAASEGGLSMDKLKEKSSSPQKPIEGGNRNSDLWSEIK